MRPIGRWEAAAAVDGVSTITNLHQLQLVSTNLTGSYRLAADIDAATSGSSAAGIWGGIGFQPIGKGPAFSGTFDGAGHSIATLTINAPTTTGVGLFAILDGSVRDLTLQGGSVTGYGSVGALAGYMNGNGTVSNVAANVTVTGTDVAVGGLIGNPFGGSITNSHASGTVSGRSTVGGLTGEGGATITGSYATGSVTGTADSVGGLVGRSIASVTDSYATGTVTGRSDVGGLIGLQNGGALSDSFASGSVTGTGDEVGGLVGRASSGEAMTRVYAGILNAIIRTASPWQAA